MCARARVCVCVCVCVCVTTRSAERTLVCKKYFDWRKEQTDGWSTLLIDNLLHWQSPPNIISVMISRSVLSAGNWAPLEGNFCSIRLGLLIYGLFCYLPFKKESVIFRIFVCPHPHFKLQRRNHAFVSDRELCSLNKSFLLFKSLLFLFWFASVELFCLQWMYMKA